MKKIKQYMAKRIKDGAIVRGYAAQEPKSGRVWIMIPAGESSFHIVEVDGETVEEIASDGATCTIVDEWLAADATVTAAMRTK